MAQQKKETKGKAESKKTGIPQYSIKGEMKSDVVASEIFSQSVSPKLIAQYVRMHQTNDRQGTASTKTRGEVGGSTKKIYKQKGTGRARHGSKKAPIFKGGGIVGGPKPKTYRLLMNKKQKKLALFGSLRLKLDTASIINLDLDPKQIETKTKTMSLFCKQMQFIGKKVLFVLPSGVNTPFIRSVSNLSGATCLVVNSINAYEILKAGKIVFVGDALKELETLFSPKNEN